MERERMHVLLIVCVHIIIYYAINLTILIQYWGIDSSDYVLNYMDAVTHFLDDPRTLYQNEDNVPFRALPALIFYYLIIDAISPTAFFGIILCSAWILSWNMYCVIIIIQITKLEQFKSIQATNFLKDPRVLVLFYLCYTWHSPEYHACQTNTIAGFFIVLALYYFLQEKESSGFIALSVSTTFKLFSAFLVLFFLARSKKHVFLKNLVVIILSFIPNLLMYAIWPSLIFSFIEENAATAIAANGAFFPSGSFARLLSKFFSVPFFPAVFIVAGIVLPVGLTVFVKRRDHMNIIEQAIFALTCGIVVFPDFYPGHSVMLWAVMVLWIGVHNSNTNPALKWLYFLTIFFVTPAIFNSFYAVLFLIILVGMLLSLIKPSINVSKPGKMGLKLQPNSIIWLYFGSIADLLVMLLIIILPNLI